MIPCGAQALFLVEVLADGAANHFALNGESIHVAVGFIQPEKVLTTGHAQFDEFVAFFDADFADVAVPVDRTFGDLFEIVAIVDNNLLADGSQLTFSTSSSTLALIVPRWLGVDTRRT